MATEGPTFDEPDDGTTLTDIRVLEGVHTCLVDETSFLQCVIKDRLCLVVDLWVVGLDIPVGGDTDGLAVGTEGDDAGVSILAGILANGVDEGSAKGYTDLLDGHCLVEGHHVVTSSSEVDALAESTDSEADDEQDGGNPPDGKRLLIHTHEVELGVLHHVTAVSGREGEVLPLVFLHLGIVDQTGHEDSGEEGYADTDHQSSCETTDRTCTEDVQDDTGNQ